MSYEYSKAAQAHMIADSLDIPFGAAWRVAGCVRKRQYITEDDAERAAERLGMRAYRCDICNRWHLSSHRHEG